MIQILPYQPEYKSRWDDFVQNHSRNGTIFQEQGFLAYHPEGKFEDQSLIFLEEEVIIGVFPAATAAEKKIVSHPGSSSGGLVFAQKCGLREVLIMIDALLLHYKHLGMEEIEFRLTEPLFSWPVGDELTYALWHRGFNLKTKEISTCIPFEPNYDWMDWGRKKNIFDIRKAEKEGYQVKLESSTDLAWEIVNRNLDNRYQKAPTHSKSELSTLHSFFPNRVHPWVCKNPQGEELASVICLEANRNAIHDFYIAQDYGKVKLNLMPFVFYNILNHYQQSGYKWFNFGISSRADWIKWGILEFKERIGGRAQTRDTWNYSGISNYVPYEFNPVK